MKSRFSKIRLRYQFVVVIHLLFLALTIGVLQQVLLTNHLFAVGLVSLPGMMTGQILSGVSPLIAVRYQIVVMCMIFGSAGISAAFYLWLMRKG